MDSQTLRHLRIAMVSSCPEAWGGSEELWAGAARVIARDGHTVQALKVRLDVTHPRVQELLALGCTWLNLSQVPTLPRRIINRMKPYAWQYSNWHLEKSLVHKHLRRFKPDLVVISQGSNFDGMHFAEVCHKAGYPYVLVVQKAVEFFFPWGCDREVFRTWYRAAERCFFVSRHNLECTENQLATTLPNGTVVANPFNVSVGPPLPYPATEGPLELACVARLFLLDKGQDVLLRVLAQDRWKARDVRVTFYGSGSDREAIAELAVMRGVTNIEFAGHVGDITGVWARHHALILPSRSEGLPLALVEAMLCGRMAIATDAGGVAEVLEDNQTGFLAAAPTVAALDEALERAWVRRAEWEAIGVEAARRVRALVPTDPIGDFVAHLMAIASAVTSVANASAPMN